MRLWSLCMFCALVSLVLPAAGNADTSEKITLAVMPFNPQGGMSEYKTLAGHLE